MEYEFERHLIDEPEQCDQNGLFPPGVLSNMDKTWAQNWYPGVSAKPASLEPFKLVVTHRAPIDHTNRAIANIDPHLKPVAVDRHIDDLMRCFERPDGRNHAGNQWLELGLLSAGCVISQVSENLVLKVERTICRTRA